MTRCLRTARTAATLALAVAACRPASGCRGEYCGTLVLAVTGEPATLLPPVSDEIRSRDIADQILLPLAELGPSGNTVGDADFQPLLAQRWEWEDPMTLVFHLDPRARWHDGQSVTAADVAFTFDAYRDPAVNSPARPLFGRIGTVTARDSLTVVMKFRERYPEMFYDAVAHARILPSHLLGELPRGQWAAAPFGRAPVGNGPYRFVSWTPNAAVELVADSTFFLGRPHIRRLVWRFFPDHPTAVTQVVEGAADAIEVLVTPDNVARARDAEQLALYPYKGSAFGYLGFNLRAPGDPGRPHPVLGDREVRRALAMAVDRDRLRESVFGDLARVPPGPIPQAWPLWEPRPRELPYDTAAAARLLTERGWVDANGDGVRERGGAPLAFRILLPGTSGIRRQYGRLLQEQLRAVGVRVELDEVEGPVFGERAANGRFDALLAVLSVDPTPSSGVSAVWTAAAIGGGNQGRYSNPSFDRLVAQASRSSAPPDSIRVLWRRALETWNDDAPAIALFANENVAAVHRRVADVRIRDDSYWALLRTWRIPPNQLIERDRAVPAEP